MDSHINKLESTILKNDQSFDKLDTKGKKQFKALHELTNNKISKWIQIMNENKIDLDRIKTIIETDNNYLCDEDYFLKKTLTE